MVLWVAKCGFFVNFHLISCTNICKMIEETKKDGEIVAKMEKYRKEHGVSYTFIGNNTEVTPSYARKILLNKVPLSKNMRENINKLWGTDF